jgi:hypothetical protein
MAGEHYSFPHFLHDTLLADFSACGLGDFDTLYVGIAQLLGFDSPLGQETSNCSGPAMNSVIGETYKKTDGG